MPMFAPERRERLLRQVADLAAQGKGPADIARETGLSLSTVNRYRKELEAPPVPKKWAKRRRPIRREEPLPPLMPGQRIDGTPMMIAKEDDDMTQEEERAAVEELAAALRPREEAQISGSMALVRERREPAQPRMARTTTLTGDLVNMLRTDAGYVQISVAAITASTLAEGIDALDKLMAELTEVLVDLQGDGA